METIKSSLNNPISDIVVYKKVIKSFKKRGDVQNGKAIGYHDDQNPNGRLRFENWPKSIGYIGTTGYCVSASQALLLDPIFQILIKDRGAFAKLISIDIKEQYYGVTYSGSQNKWHTAILVEDTLMNYMFIIDLTCSQFGNNFNGKDIWDFKTWESTLRSPLDKHQLVNHNGDNIGQSYVPNNLNFQKENPSELTNIIKLLYDITTITDEERRIIAEFFQSKIKVINKKLLIGNVNSIDFKYLTIINKLIENLDFKQIFDDSKQYYSILEFNNKESSLKWIENFIKNNNILQQYIIAFERLDDACKYFDIIECDLNVESLKEKTFIILEISPVKGVDTNFIGKESLCIPYGIKLNVNPKEDIFNGGKKLGTDVVGAEKRTNTIYVRCSN